MALTKASPIKVEPFEGDLRAITEIQTSMLQEAEEFCLFRKAEFDNAMEMASFLAARKDQIPLLTPAVPFGIGSARELVAFTRKMRSGKLMNERSEFAGPRGIWLGIVTMRTDRNNDALLKLVDLEAHIYVIPYEATSRLRYFVTDRQYCAFFRRQENNFWGLLGTDDVVREWLIDLFLRDCNGGTRLGERE